MPPELQKNSMTATPPEWLGFLQARWLQKHCGTMLPDGSVAAAVHSLENAIAALATAIQSDITCCDQPDLRLNFAAPAKCNNGKKSQKSCQCSDRIEQRTVFP